MWLVKDRQLSGGAHPRPEDCFCLIAYRKAIYFLECFMKKILFVTTISGFLPQFEMGDVHIVRGLGYEVHYASNFENPVYSFEKEDLQKEGIILHQVEIEKSPLKLLKNLRAVNQVRRLIDQEKIDLIHCHNPMGGMVGRIAAHHSKNRPYVIYTAHGFHFYKGAPLINWIMFYPAERYMAKRTDAIVTINKEDYNRANRFRLRNNGQIVQIHSVGINLDRFAPRPGLREKKRAELGIPEDAFHIVTAAELNDNKNQKIIIEAIADCEDKGIYYSICGKGPNREKLEKIIEKLGLGDRVRLLGYRTDMDEVLQSADVFAFPSIREGLGIAAVEALACGVPLIVSDNRGTREYAENGTNSLVCDSGSVSQFIEAIKRLYRNKKYRKMLSEHCRPVAERFGLRETGRIMEGVYKAADEAVNVRHTKVSSEKT